MDFYNAIREKPESGSDQGSCGPLSQRRLRDSWRLDVCLSFFSHLLIKNLRASRSASVSMIQEYNCFSGRMRPLPVGKERRRFPAKESYTVKKAFFGALASLMLAGAISAASGLTTPQPAGSIVMIGDGASPILIETNTADDARDHASRIR